MVFDPASELGMIIGILALALGICLAVAVLAVQWSGNGGAGKWTGVLVAGVWGPVGLAIAFALVYMLMGESFVTFDPMQFL